MKKIVLLINGNLGLGVLRYVSTQKNVEIKGVILNSAQKRKPEYLQGVDRILKEFGLIVPVLSYENDSARISQTRQLLQDSEFGISALFGHVLPKELLEDVNCEIINLHPSLLPIGRGADPIPWSIIGQQKQGVSIHVIDSGLDTGAILSQKEITCDIGMSAGEIYDIATDMLLKELENIFTSWINGSMQLIEQTKIQSSAHKSKDLEKIRITNSRELLTFGDFLRKLQALTYSDGRKPLFIDDSGRLWRIDITLTIDEEYQKGKIE